MTQLGEPVFVGIIDPVADDGLSRASSQPPAPMLRSDLAIFPRKKANILDGAGRVKNLLPAYPSAGGSPIKNLEFNFYPDLKDTRTFTVLLTDTDWNPISGVCPSIRDGTVTLEILGADPADFSLSATSGSTSGGYFEFQLKVKKLYDESEMPQHQVIQIKATVAGSKEAILKIAIHRNEDVDYDLGALLEFRTLLVAQKSKFVKSAGAKRLQELLNQIVARHKAAAEFRWLEFDQTYGNDCKTDVKAFLTHFSGSFDYKKGHFGVAVDADLKEYVKSEYGSYEDGCLVDQHLLIGDAPWTASDPIDKADGLSDIYEATVPVFFACMDEQAANYIENFTTNWLHEPAAKPYQKGDDIVNAYFVAEDNSANLMQTAGGANIVATAECGETLSYLGEEAKVGGVTWRKVSRATNESGWIRSDRIKPVRNDAGESEDNSGLLGSNGVAYSWGGKDTPEHFKERLEANEPGPGEIKCWEQYTKKRASFPKCRPRDRVDGQGFVGSGCDCAGFVQNCITAAILQGANERIVPEGILKEIKRLPILTHYNGAALLTSQFVGPVAREIPWTANASTKQWADKTDLIVSPGHIVWISQSAPDTRSAKGDFEIVNEYGDGQWFKDNGIATEPDDIFIRKALRMPFYRWGVFLGRAGIQMGRVYFWS